MVFDSVPCGRRLITYASSKLAALRNYHELIERDLDVLDEYA